MQVTLGPVTRTAERFKGDKLAHNTADLLVNGVKIGTVHDSGYAPKWAYNLSEFRSKPEVAKYIWGGSAVKPTDYLIHCDAGFTSPESARAQVEDRLTEFDKLTAPPPEKLVWEHRPRTKNCAGLASAGPYVISKRPGNFTLSYRPPGQHVSLGSHPTIHDAKRAAKDHNADKRKAAAKAAAKSA